MTQGTIPQPEEALAALREAGRLSKADVRQEICGKWFSRVLLQDSPFVIPEATLLDPESYDHAYLGKYGVYDDYGVQRTLTRFAQPLSTLEKSVQEQDIIFKPNFNANARGIATIARTPSGIRFTTMRSHNALPTGPMIGCALSAINPDQQDQNILAATIPYAEEETIHEVLQTLGLYRVPNKELQGTIWGRGSFDAGMYEPQFPLIKIDGCAHETRWHVKGSFHTGAIEAVTPRLARIGGSAAFANYNVAVDAKRQFTKILHPLCEQTGTDEERLYRETEERIRETYAVMRDRIVRAGITFSTPIQAEFDLGWLPGNPPEPALIEMNITYADAALDCQLAFAGTRNA